MKKLLPIILAVLGIGIGGGVGFLLKPPTSKPEDIAATCIDMDLPLHAATDTPPNHEDDMSSKEYVKLNNQFVVPIVKDDIVTSLILISLSVEVDAGNKDAIFEREPKLRDALLQVMFDHANMGGFRGAFTNSSNLDVLRHSLRETARGTLGSLVSDILIQDIARQEV